jgi:dipeptide/tripeptide permease
MYFNIFVYFLQKVPYPKSVFIIVGNEFCERLSYYGMKAILGIYLHKKLHLSEDKSTVIYHTFAMLCYFTPIFGAMIADQLLGRFKTIVYISMIYVLGHLLKTLAAIPTLGIPPL